jgi:ubiquinone/menaquinone biosynthesis C-methylase UbiE
MTTNNDYALSVGISDLERMTMLGETYMPYCAEFLIENGLKQGLNIADISCGPGNTSLWLSQQVGMKGKVLAIDNSDAQLNILRKKILDRQFTSEVQFYS